MPKGWTYNTELFKLTYSDIPPEIEDFLKKSSIRNPDDIKKAIEIGYFVPQSEIDNSHIETEFEKGKGFRLVKKFGAYVPSSKMLDIFEFFSNYEEAEQTVKEHYKELEFESNMTDVEWSVYQIDRTLDKSLMAESERNRCRELLLNMDRIEDIQTRIRGIGHIQWKYCKNKRWNDI